MDGRNNERQTNEYNTDGEKRMTWWMTHFWSNTLVYYFYCCLSVPYLSLPFTISHCLCGPDPCVSSYITLCPLQSLCLFFNSRSVHFYVFWYPHLLSLSPVSLAVTHIEDESGFLNITHNYTIPGVQLLHVALFWWTQAGIAADDLLQIRRNGRVFQIKKKKKDKKTKRKNANKQATPPQKKQQMRPWPSFLQQWKCVRVRHYETHQQSS